MRIESLGLFNPLCESKLVITNRETVRQPVSGLNCKPCMEPLGENEICCRNCFQLELQDITIDPQTYCGTESGGIGYLDTTGGTFTLTGCDGNDAPCGASPIWEFGCRWGFAEIREKVPGNINPSSEFSITLRTVSATEAVMNIFFAPYNGSTVGYIQKGFFCHNFSCMGGTFVNESSPYDGPSEYNYCVGTDADWPDTLEVVGVLCE